MKSLITIVIFLFIHQLLSAQNEAQSKISHAIDSLKLEKYRSAIPLLESAIKEDCLSPKQYYHIQMLLEISYYHSYNLKFDLSKLENSVNHIQSDDPFNINGFESLMQINNRLKNYEKSLFWGKKGLSLFKNYKSNVYYAELSSEMAQSYYDLAKYPEAMGYYSHAIQIIDNHYGKQHKSYFFWLERLANCYAKQGDFLKAIEFESQALERKENFAIVFSYRKLSDYYLKIGDSSKYDEYLLKFKNRMYSSGLDKVIASDYKNNNLDVLATDYSKSIEIQKLKTELIKEKFGENDKTYAASLIDLAFLNYKLANYNEAIDVLLKVIPIYKNLFGQNDKRYLSVMANLALYYGKNNDYLQALEIGNQVLQSQQRTIGLSDSNRISWLDKLDVLPDNISVLSKSYKDISVSLHNLAFSYSGLKDYKSAIRLDSEAILILKKVGRKSNYEDSRPIETLASYYLAINNYEESLKLMDELVSIRKEIITSNFLLYSEKEKTTYWSNLKNSFETDYPSYSYQCFHLNPSVSKFAYNNELFKKGLLLNTLLEFRQSILESKDTILVDNWFQFQNLKQEIFRLEEKPSYLQSKMDTLQLNADKLEIELVKSSKEYLQSKKDLDIQWQDVQSKLNEGEVAIEFSSFNYFRNDWTDSTLYIALVLKKGMEYPIMIPLCEQKQLDSLFAGGKAAPNNLYASSRAEVDSYNFKVIKHGDRLYDLIWKPLEKQLLDVKTIYYSPSGTLHQISFAALSTDSTHYLCDKYNLIQLSSTRQLATSAWLDNTKQINSTSLFGGIRYDLEDQEVAELKQSFHKNELALSRGFTLDSTRSSKSFNFLEGTKSEVESISTELKANNIKTALYMGINGNEETFNALSNQNIHVLHIATHGFFYPDENLKPDELDRMMSLREQRFKYVPNPLLRSGLVLAGGNRAWKGEEPIPGMEDGILTAQEISEMNLLNTELVVLSACETGLGDIQGGEGVFGLLRAFKLAGVKTIIMSLWKVPDAETSELMQSFYHKWLGGMDKHEAFRLSQKEIKLKHPEPYYWAGFVMVD